MTGRELHAQWSGSDPSMWIWRQLSPADKRAWDRLAAWMLERERAAVAAVIARREGS